MEIGNVIKKYRIKKNMTQEELGAALLVTPQAVSRWETGISYPDISMIPEIVKVLGVSADKLLGCDSSAANEGKEQSPALDFRKLTLPIKETKKKVLNQNQIDSIFDYMPQPVSGAKMVLIVDDSDFMRMMLTDILSHEHHRVIQAPSGEEGLKTLKGETCGIAVDVCILDIRLPGMDGLDVLKVIKREYPDLKIIMLSALHTEEIVKKALELGADSFVAKPFQASTILERV